MEGEGSPGWDLSPDSTRYRPTHTIPPPPTPLHHLTAWIKPRLEIRTWRERVKLTRMSRGCVPGKKAEDVEPFIFRWCDKYGLSEGSAAILLAEGFNTAAELLAITSEVIKELPLTMGQKLLFRGALLQFKEGDVLYAQRRARKYKIPVEDALFMTKQALIDLAKAREHEEKHGPTREMLTQQELEERLELRRRIRRKKNRGQGKVRETLAERIQNQRQSLIHGQSSAMSGSKCSLASESSSASYGTIRTEPIGHVTSTIQSDQRCTRSAMEAPITGRRLSETSTKIEEIDRDIEDILTDEAQQEIRSRSTGQHRTPRGRQEFTPDGEGYPESVTRNSQKDAQRLKNEHKCDRESGKEKEDGEGNINPHNPRQFQHASIKHMLKSPKSTATISKPDDEETKGDMEERELISKMEHEVDSLLRELSGNHKLRKVTNPGGEIKRANEILDRELLTEEEMKMANKQ